MQGTNILLENLLNTEDTIAFKDHRGAQLYSAKIYNYRYTSLVVTEHIDLVSGTGSCLSHGNVQMFINTTASEFKSTQLIGLFRVAVHLIMKARISAKFLV